MAFKIEFKGIEGLITSVRKYPERVTKDIQLEIRDWAERTEQKAIQDAPFQTGALKSSIRAVLGANKLTWIVKAGGINGVNYAPYVEFGTGTKVDKTFLQQYGLVQYASQFKANPKVREVNLPANTFLYRNARTEFEKSVKEIQEIIDRAWKR